ncbi:hypothetical protein O6H91_19G038600 [Diphasiastrum complanatum]|uniref:Uncharacterized protein n=1 Tax=Diphasiastrum complanatum TaxID=34168 RepID=A0ACC2AU82_DIPCM|nr:hypothetical protein O6H91_19G038600 [Diphasiastrum complanatum]
MFMVMVKRAEFTWILVLLVFSSFLRLCRADGVAMAGGGGPHISNLNLLLPQMASHPVHYRLQASGGCFTWSWDHHDVLSLEAEYNKTSGCSTSAIITSIAPYNGRRATAVHARDQSTGYLLRCEVFVDKLSRIQIFHHSVKLDLDGFATLRVRGFDSEENVFSTLVGLRFAWHLLPHPPTVVLVPHRLTHVPLKDTPLNNCDCTCSEIDTQGFGSDLYVVQGVRAGQETVTAILEEPDMEELVDAITLTVAEPIFIEPTSPSHIIPGTKLKFRLLSIRHNTPSDVQLPSPHYEWLVTNSSVATVDNTGLLHGKDLGVTMVVVQDNRVPGHQQTSTVHVVTPSVIRLYLYPLSVKGVGPRVPISAGPFISSADILWHLVVGRDYVVQVLVFSEKSTIRPLYLTQDNELELFFRQLPYWDAIPIPEDVASEQGWRNASLIHALSEGDGTLAAVLALENGIGDENLDDLAFHIKQVFRVDQAMKVCSPVKIILGSDFDGMRSFILPWVPGVSQAYHLRAESGCGGKATDYLWTSSDPSVATVSTQGVVKSQGPGKAFVQAAYHENSLNVDEVMVEVEIPWSIKPLQGLTVEAEVGYLFPVAVTLLTDSGEHFSACDAFNGIINWSISEGDGKFLLMDSSGRRSLQILKKEFSDVGTTPYVQKLPDNFSTECAGAQFLAVSPGRAVVTATFSLNDNLGSLNTSDIKRLWEVSWMMAAYPPLRLEQVEDGKNIGAYDCDDGLREATSDVRGFCSKELTMFLVVGSSMKVILHGGPERWRQGVDFINYCEILPIDDAGGGKDDVLVVRDTDGGGRVYSLICTDSGNHTLLFHRGNLVVEDNFAHLIAIASLRLVCDIPASVALLIDESESTLLKVKSATQLQWDETQMQIDPVTIVNRRTINVTAMALHISGQPFTNFSSLYFSWSLESCNDLACWEGGDSNGGVQVGSWQKRLVLENATGECTLVVKIEKIKQLFLAPLIFNRLNNIIKQKQLSLTDGVKLQLVDMLRLEPHESVLFAHPDAKANFAVVGGSSELESHTNDSNVAVVIPQPSATKNSYLKVAARGLGIAEVLVRDVGIMTPMSTSALVIVSDIASVRALLREDASMQLYLHMLVQLQAGDSGGQIFHSSQFQFMNIEVHLHDEMLELVSNQSITGPVTKKIYGDTFTIRGANVGLTSFHVSARPRSGREVHSDIYRVSVYAPLSIHPSRLDLAPGARYVITTLGGPKGGFSVQFLSSDVKVATIDSIAGRVVAKSPGNTALHALAYDVSGNLMTKCSIEVQVCVPSSMHLEIRSGRLSVGQEMSIYPVASMDVDLFSFVDVCTSYGWSIVDEQVLSFGTLASELLIANSEDGSHGTQKDSFPHDMTKNKVEHKTDSGFLARVIGRSAGRTTVSVSFMCHFYSVGQNEVPIHYKASNNIWVVPAPPLAVGLCATWVLPVNYTSSGLLPQWIDDLSSGTLSGISAHNVMYSVMHDSGSNSGISILEGGRLKTSERTDLACVQARDRNTGRSEVAACIRVAEVAQMTVGDEQFPYRVVELSVGIQEHLTVNLRDELGIPFFEAGVGSTSQLVVDTNRADVVSLKIPDVQHWDGSSNITIFVQAIRQGTALIRVCYKGNRHISDFVLIHVGVYLAPQNPMVHFGSHVNFSVIGKSEHGSWSSSNSNILKIDSHTGKALAIGEGVVTVSFSGSRLATYTLVTVVKVTLAKIEAPDGVRLLTNVPRPEQGYKFPVKFSDSQGRDVGIVGKEHMVTYECLMQPNFIGKIVPWHEPGKDKLYCILWPYSPEKSVSTLEQHVISENGSIIMGDPYDNLQVTVAVVGLGAPYAVGVVKTTFVGGFSVLETAVQLSSPRKNRTLIRVVGNIGGVQVSWFKRNAIEAVCTSTKHYGIGGIAIYEVKLLEDEDSFSDTLVFTLPETGQNEEIPVRYDAGHVTISDLSRQFILVMIALAVLIATLFIVCTRVHDLSGPLRPAAGVLTSPSVQQRDHVSPAGDTALDAHSNGLQTPLHQRTLSRTPPQPYTDYVGRTIEHTPYYSRQGVRKFDPSRTY